jgi:ERCC4-type nuclease
VTAPILIDPRVGSKDLVKYFDEGTVELSPLQYGDVSFGGRGPEGCPWQIGIERKVVGDLCACIGNGRFAGHQLPGLLSTYNFSYLLVEGLMRCDLSNGYIKVYRNGGWEPVIQGSRQFTVNEVMGFLNTVTTMTGVRVWQTDGARETAAYVKWLHHWWNSKDMDEHRAHIAVNRSIQIRQHTTAERIIAALPGISSKAPGVLKHFGSVRTAMNADAKEWAEVKGIGKTIAQRIVATVRGE